MPEVSIIIPVCNVEKYIRQALDSVVNQTFKDIEIICVDDCTPDRSFEIVREYAAKDTRIKLLSLSENSGVGTARNRALETASGRYVMFLDPDDWFAQDAVGKAYTAIKTADVDVVFFDLFFNKEKKNGTYKEKSGGKSKNFIRFAGQEGLDLGSGIFPFFNAWCWIQIYSLDFLRRHGISFSHHRFAEDLQFMVMLYAAGAKFSVLCEQLYHYRIKQQYTVVDYSSKFDCVIETKRAAQKLIEKSPYSGILKPLFFTYEVRSDLYFMKNFSSYRKKSGELNYRMLRERFLEIFQENQDFQLSRKHRRDFMLVLKNKTLSGFKISRFFKKILAITAVR